MFSRKKELEALVDVAAIKPEFTPFEVVAAHKLIMQRIRKGGGQPPAKLPKRVYRPVGEFDLTQDHVRIGSLGDVVPALGIDTTKRYFQIATRLGQMGALTVPRFNVPMTTYDTVTLGLTAPSHNSFLVYGLQDSFAARMGGGVGGSAYTTGKPMLKAGDPSVSFVGIPSLGPDADYRMAAATEIFQSRMHVVDFRDGREIHEEQSHIEPFQESLANGMGNALGHIALGSNYGQYKSYMMNYYKLAPVFGYNLADGSGMAAAPHLLARKGFYQQLADGEVLINAGDIQFTPLMSDKR
jgi:hypothetical protein